MIKIKDWQTKAMKNVVEIRNRKIIKYILLNNLMWIIGIVMCYLDCFIDNINYSVQDFLILFFELLAHLTLVVGAIRTFPPDRYSNKRIWFYCAMMGGSLAAIRTFAKLVDTLGL